MIADKLRKTYEEKLSQQEDEHEIEIKELNSNHWKEPYVVRVHFNLKMNIFEKISK